MSKSKETEPNIIELPLKTLNISPYFLYTQGKNFYSIYEQIKNTKKYYLQHYFFLMRALELLLKSYLLAKGKPKNHIRRKGHDVEKVLNSAISVNLSKIINIDANEKEEIKKFSPFYQGKSLEYFNGAAAELTMSKTHHPNVKILEGLILKLIDVLKEITFSVIQ